LPLCFQVRAIEQGVGAPIETHDRIASLPRELSSPC
jgi:hypothetical protein